MRPPAKQRQPAVSSIASFTTYRHTTKQPPASRQPRRTILSTPRRRQIRLARRDVEIHHVESWTVEARAGGPHLPIDAAYPCGVHNERWAVTSYPQFAAVLRAEHDQGATGLVPPLATLYAGSRE